MGKNYYEILGVPQNASNPDIAKRFRVLALTYHPQRQQPEQIGQANFKLAEACEAYEVLSNGKNQYYVTVWIAELREIYDRYGEEILKAGIPSEKQEDSTKKRGGYRFSGNTMEIFDKFFGTENPFTITLDSK